MKGKKVAGIIALVLLLSLQPAVEAAGLTALCSTFIGTLCDPIHVPNGVRIHHCGPSCCRYPCGITVTTHPISVCVPPGVFDLVRELCKCQDALGDVELSELASFLEGDLGPGAENVGAFVQCITSMKQFNVEDGQERALKRLPRDAAALPAIELKDYISIVTRLAAVAASDGAALNSLVSIFTSYMRNSREAMKRALLRPVDVLKKEIDGFRDSLDEVKKSLSPTLSAFSKEIESAMKSAIQDAGEELVACLAPVASIKATMAVAQAHLTKAKRNNEEGLTAAAMLLTGKDSIQGSAFYEAQSTAAIRDLETLGSTMRTELLNSLQTILGADVFSDVEEIFQTLEALTETTRIVADVKEVTTLIEESVPQLERVIDVFTSQSSAEALLKVAGDVNGFIDSIVSLPKKLEPVLQAVEKMPKLVKSIENLKSIGDVSRLLHLDLKNYFGQELQGLLDRNNEKCLRLPPLKLKFPTFEKIQNFVKQTTGRISRLKTFLSNVELKPRSDIITYPRRAKLGAELPYFGGREKRCLGGLCVSIPKISTRMQYLKFDLPNHHQPWMQLWAIRDGEEETNKAQHSKNKGGGVDAATTTPVVDCDAAASKLELMFTERLMALQKLQDAAELDRDILKQSVEHKRAQLQLRQDALDAKQTTVELREAELSTEEELSKSAHSDTVRHEAETSTFLEHADDQKAIANTNLESIAQMRRIWAETEQSIDERSAAVAKLKRKIALRQLELKQLEAAKKMMMGL